MSERAINKIENTSLLAQMSGRQTFILGIKKNTKKRGGGGEVWQFSVKKKKSYTLSGVN